MNQVDLFILVVIIATAIGGARRGLINSAGDVIALVVGLAVGSLAYPIGAAPLKWILGPSSPIAGALGFVVVAGATVWLLSWGFAHLSEHFEPSRAASLAGGATFGTALGVIMAAVLVLASGLLPGAGQAVSKSALAPRITGYIPRLHESLESIGLPLPKLVQLPRDYREEISGMRQGLQFLRINFTRLDGAMCIHCRAPVAFLGYQFAHGTLMTPEYQCPRCGRTSDGCQTFQGFHTIYGRCPVEVAKEGVEFDCGVWTNHWWTLPHGPCPVCGRELRKAGRMAGAKRSGDSWSLHLSRGDIAPALRAGRQELAEVKDPVFRAPFGKSGAPLAGIALHQLHSAVNLGQVPSQGARQPFHPPE